MTSAHGHAAVTRAGRLAAGFEVPASLARNVADDDEEDGPARRAWLEELPRIVADLAERWSLRVGRPFQPGGNASWVAPARDAAGRRLVLKAGWRHEEAEHEAEGLRAWNGRGAVRVFRSLLAGSTSALLLEACEPGTPLERALPPREQDVVVAGLLFRLLPATAARRVLLCTDLHPGNVLAAAREPWLVIDPKPVTGDPAYDPLQHMLNFPGRLAGDPGGFADRMAGLLGLDAGRLRSWLFARCVQESVGVPYLRAAAIQLAP